MAANIYQTITDELRRQLNSMKLDADGKIPNSGFPIGCKKILAHLTDPKRLKDEELPAIAYKLGSRVKDDSITTTVQYKGYAYSIAVHAIVRSDEEEKLEVRSNKMITSMDMIASALRHLTSDDGSTVQNCEIPLVDNLFKHILTERDYLLFQFAFEIVELA